MTSRAAASRYARALFDVVRADGDPVQAGADLDTFVGVVSEHADLQRVLLTPAVPTAAKVNILDGLLGMMGLSQPVTRLLRMLAERDRIALVPDVVATYRERLLEFQQVVKADVTTAVSLSPEKAAALQHSLAEATGKQVLLQTSVDPAILGGVIARVGSRVFDGSVARHLARVKAQLIEAAQ